MKRTLKRALWCRWFHRWRASKPSRAVNTDPATGQSLVLSAGPHRTCCWACEDDMDTRMYRKWLAS